MTVPDRIKRAVVDAVILGGISEDEAAKLFDQPISNVKRWVRDAEDQAPLDGDPIAYERLGRQAKESLADFGVFTRRYFGRIHTPWQIDAANRVAGKLSTPHKEFIVLNCPPGVGKTTVFAHDIPAWLTARNRSLRGQLGHKSFRTSQKYVSRLRRTLARPGKFHPSQEDIDRGLALEPEGSLVADFGRFKPLARDLWRADEFVVEQPGSELIIEKESTWTAVGQETEFTGLRYQFINWDDLVSKQTLRSPSQVEEQRDWWVTVAQERLEPGGVLLLVGQRLGPNDLYRYCLDLETLADDAADEDGDAELTVIEPEVVKRYTHIVYPAHFDDLCTDNHKNLRPWPESCLLDPVRVSWREIAAARERRDGTYEVVLQQKDVAPHEMLVRKNWLWGGEDDDGSACPGCFDKDRGYGQFPPWAPDKPLPLSYVTIDPSGTNYWSVQHWLYDADRDMDWLIQFEKRKYQINEILTWNFDTNKYEGLLEDMRRHAAGSGHPITHIVLEINAMNRWANQQDIWRRWEQQHSIITIQHTTHLNKSDPDKGVEAMCNRYRFGKVRFPGATRRDEIQLRPFTEELSMATTSNGTGRSAGDAMMAQWFGVFNHDNMTRRRRKGGDSGPRKTPPPWKPMGYKRSA